ncbi:MAG: translation initiation factor IF-2 [Vicinamibacterales bacterium]|nr:translation initiation factor IF-2 [Acidobacteriota bacterium]MDP6373576.1 translation initiation factor IF-2 [Vicinamibacterales bacterium]MDP6609132.1 translation initiation factor IF-2 [Vicinamibacterales bacterium]
MATVRIYKVAEVLNTTSQDVVALLKRDHGIDVKSASSTIEEVVARQFVERVARDRGLSVPGGPMFTGKPKAKSRKGRASARTAEPAKPASRPLPPPRLVKVKPKPAPEEGEAEADAEATDAVADAAPTQPPALAADGAPVEVAEPVVAASPEVAAAEPEPVPEPAAPTPPPRAARIVPPTLRLRVEDDSTPAAPKAAAPQTTVKRPTPPPPRPATRPVAGGGVPRVAVSPSRPPIGGTRPAPSPTTRSPLPPRPGGLPHRGRRPPFRPGGRSGRRKHPRATAPAAPAPAPEITRTITLAEGMTVKDLADKLDTRPKDVLKKLMEKRIMTTINTTLDNETATMIAREFGADVEMRSFEEEMLHVEQQEAQPEDLEPRAPVVTVMGHVDHGKTTLLDAIRETRVAEREAGGITQHIGAYAVSAKDQRIVFLDTPGHAAFTLMRARGAKVTDVVVLVVAADDGVMPQTKEAIDHARAAGVPIIVAVNKIDKPDANPDRVKTELSDLDLAPEAWGGKTVTVDVSAKKGENIELLLEMILLVTELGELKANPKRNAAGTVLEAKLDRGRGPVATILVQDGTLRVGDTFIAGTVVGKVRALLDDRGRQIKLAAPSTPVEVLGLGGLPQPGDAFQALPDAAKARQIANLRQTQAKERALGAKSPRLTLESLQEQITEGGIKELPIIIKADVQGSAEVLSDTLTKLSDERVKIRIIHEGVGAINESDALLASASNAIVIGFSVRPDRNATEVAERDGLDMRLHSVIYNVTDEIKKAMAGLLDPTTKEVRLGSAEVRETFKVPKFGLVAGCIVTDGRITRAGDAQARLLRDNVVVHEGRIGSLRRFKDDVSEVKTGVECGIAFERFNDIKVGDVIEAFTVEQVAATV